MEYTGREPAPLYSSVEWVQWAGARWNLYPKQKATLSCKLGRDMSHSKMDLEQLDALIEWKVHRWQYLRNMAQKEGNKMAQEQWTIEVRADFSDKDKIPEVTKIACAAARHMVANIMLLGPTCKPECVIFTDNFMSGPEKIDIYSDLIGKGQKELRDIASSGVSGAVTDTVTEGDQEDCVSQELLDAMKR